MRSIEAQSDGSSAACVIDDAGHGCGFPQERCEVVAHELGANSVRLEAGGQLFSIGTVGTRDAGVVDKYIESGRKVSSCCMVPTEVRPK